MSDIKILKIDENKSRASDSNPLYTLVLSDAPSQEWRVNLDSAYQQSRNTQIFNVRAQGKELTLTTTAGLGAKQMLSAVQGLLDKVNSSEDAFLHDIREVNKELGAGGSQ